MINFILNFSLQKCSKYVVFLIDYGPIKLAAKHHSQIGTIQAQYGQILQIQDCRPHWNIKNRQIGHQFCTENYDISSPIDDNTNSSSPISSMAEMPTSIEQNEQPAETFDGANSTSPISSPAETPTNTKQLPIPYINKLYNEYFMWNNLHSNKKMLNLKLHKGKNGQKFFRIWYFNYTTQFRLNFANILVPEDAYTFINKMDELVRELADQKFILQDNVDQSKNVKRQTFETMGKFHKFQLELFFFPNMDRNESRKQLCIIRLCALNLELNKISSLFLPLEALLWLREHMVDMLVRDDGTETISKEAPAKIPKQFLMNGLVLKNKMKKLMDE